MGEHPLRLWRPALDWDVDADSRDLPRRVGQAVRIAGLLEAYCAAETQNGRMMKFFTFDDEYGLFEASAVADACRLTGKPAGDTTPALVAGAVEEHHGVLTISAREIVWYDREYPPED